MSGTENNNEMFIEQEAIPGMGTLGGTTPRLNDFNTKANLAIISVFFGAKNIGSDTGKNYTQNPRTIGTQQNGYGSAHMHRRLHQDNTRNHV